MDDHFASVRVPIELLDIGDADASVDIFTLFSDPDRRIVGKTCLVKSGIDVEGIAIRKHAYFIWEFFRVEYQELLQSQVLQLHVATQLFQLIMLEVLFVPS